MPNEIGALWENFAIAERVKKTIYDRTFCNQWFWRTKTQHEIDYIEESNGVISAFEFKRSPKKVVQAPQSFVTAYPNCTFQCVTPENIEDFLL